MKPNSVQTLAGFPGLLVLIIILHTSSSRYHPIVTEDRDYDELRFFDVSSTDSFSNLGKDLNNIYTGWVNTSGSFYPMFLKGSTWSNAIYGAIGNRTGMVVAGSLLLGGTGNCIQTCGFQIA